MKFEWNAGKNEVLKRTRGISFELLVVAIEEGNVLDILDHPNIEKYPNQKVYVVKLLNKVFFIPVVYGKGSVFMKTAFRSRKLEKIYLGKR